MDTSEQSFFEDQHAFMTVHHLTLRGTNFEIEPRLGEIAKERFGMGRAANDAARTSRSIWGISRINGQGHG